MSSKEVLAKNTPVLLARESWDECSSYVPQTERMADLRPRTIAQALLRNPGRFRSPLSLWERWKLRLYEASLELDFFRITESLVFPTSAPKPDYPWQILVRYLARQGIIVDERTWQALFFHDDIKFISIRFVLPQITPGKIVATGNGLQFEAAFSKAIGEVLERFFLLKSETYRVPIDRRASAASLRRIGTRFVEPSMLSQFTPEQIATSPWMAFDDESRFAWVKGKAVDDGRAILLPAQSIAIEAFAYRGVSEPLLREQNSNGAAGGFTLTEAVLSGIYEAVERDGFLIYWLNALAPPVIDVSASEDEELQELLLWAARYRFEPYFLNTTTDIGIPSCVCVLVDRGPSGPNVTVGGGCGFNPVDIVKKSLLEAVMVRRGADRSSPDVTLKTDYQPFREARIGLSERMKLWNNPTMFPKIEPFLTGPSQTLSEAFPSARDFASREAEYAHVRDVFRRLGPDYGIYYHEKRHRILNTLGYHVVKVVIPALVSIYLKEISPPLGAKRLKEVPPKLGHEAAKVWNPWPHPIP